MKKQKNVVPVLSLEGLETETDDRRGQGVFKQLQTIVNKINKEDIFFSVSLTVSSLNLDTVTNEKFIADLVKLGCKLFFFLEYTAINQGTEEWVPSEEERTQLNLAVETFRKDYPALFISIPGDVHEDIADRYRVYIALMYSTKPVVTGTFKVDAFRVMHEMLSAVAGDQDALREKPMAIFDCCPSPPLKWSDLTAQALIDCARTGIPAELVSMPLTGATSPVTLAGAVTQHCAENLSGIVIHQLASAGAPIIYGGSPACFDMRKGTTPMGAVETQMIDGAYAEIGKHLGIPTHAYMGLSDSKTVDYQAGMESAMGATIAALSGVNNVSGPGMLDFESCQSLEKLVLDHEVCGMALRLASGIELRDDPIALPLISEALEKKEFLSLPHTARWFRKEAYSPMLSSTVTLWRSGRVRGVGMPPKGRRGV